MRQGENPNRARRFFIAISAAILVALLLSFATASPQLPAYEPDPEEPPIVVVK